MATPKIAAMIVSRLRAPKGEQPPAPHAEPDGDEPEDEDDDDDDAYEDGDEGKIALAAIRHGDAKAFEASIERIVKRCMEEDEGK